MWARVLIDNKTKDSLIPEWGLSIYIEYEGHKILLDTGASEKFLRNADICGVDISDVEFGVLSHAHYDHSDGMAAFFERNQKASFYLRKGAKENCYGMKEGKYHYNGKSPDPPGSCRNTILERLRLRYWYPLLCNR